MKKYIITGLLIWIPLVITIWVLKLIVDSLDQVLLLLPPDQIYLSRLEAELYGIQISASGTVINPQKFKFFTADKKKTEERARIAANVIAQLKKLKFDGTAPQVAVRFMGDLAKPD